MSDSGQHHGHIVCIAIVDGILIFDAAARMNDRRNTSIICYFHAIRKRKKCITCHHATL